MTLHHMIDTHRLEVQDPSQVGEARRVAARLASTLGMDQTEQGKVSIVASELAGNLIKHAGGGVLAIRLIPNAGIELLSLDRGPGMPSVAECLRDGFSTAGTPGTGLGAVKRQSNYFDVFSKPTGTAVLSRILKHDSSCNNYGSVGAICTPKTGEIECGDAWQIAPTNQGHTIIVADGLGHGPLAAIASKEAIKIFQTHHDRPLLDIVHRIHDGLRHTRGAAVALARVDTQRKIVTFCSIGNVAGAVVTSAGVRKMISFNGTLGHQFRKAQELTYPCAEGSLVVLHSDGISTSWDVLKYPGLLTRHAALAAGILYRDFCRGTDDATIVVTRCKG